MLSDNIRELRKRKGYTQETLAQALNVVRQTVSKWEKGYSVPDADMLEKMAEVFDVEVSELLGTPSELQDRESELERISSQLSILNDQMAREMARRKRNRKIGLIIAAVVFSLLIAGVAVLFTSHVHIVSAGDSSNVEIRSVPSSLYSQDEIDKAIEVIKRDFEEKDWSGCELKLIYYAGDEVSKNESKERGVPTIVLLSDFNTYEVSGYSGLNSDCTYHNWNWILIKNERGMWEHIDHGY